MLLQIQKYIEKGEDEIENQENEDDKETFIPKGTETPEDLANFA